MTSHLLFEHLDRDHRRLLSNPERSEVYEHLEACEECRELLCEVENVDEQITQVLRDLDSEMENNLEPAIRKSHLSYDQNAAYVDGRLELDNRRSIESHLKSCLQCQERVEYLFRIRNDLIMTNSYRPAVESDDKWNIRTGSSFQWLRDHQLSRQKLQTWIVCLLVVTTGILSSIVLLKHAWQRSSSQATDSSLVLPQAPVPSEQDTTHSTEFPGGKPRTSLTQVPSSKHRRETLSRAGREFYGRNEMSVKTFRYPSDLSGSFAETAKRINQVLVSEDLAKPKILSEFDDSETSLRAAEGGRRKKIKLVAPIRGVISDDRPTFRWKRLPGAVSYEVEVFDSRNLKLFPDQILPPAISEWTPPSPLPRGEIYTWVVKATTEDGEEIMAPLPPEPEMRFKVLESSKIEELRVLRSQSTVHLLVGIFCAQEGLVVEAERELENFVGENPDSLLGRRLLRTVRAWKTR